ncbi:hypothetical protein HYU17_04490 [Candidatus Woesearchaeota archaeon]|nr:hypothetical protein [Candidatus Woesearchaeota archaeon]
MVKMRFHQPQQEGNNSKNSLAEAVAEEHPKHLAAVAEQQIMAMHSHRDGSQVELHQLGSQEFIQQSIGSSLEGKLSSSNFSGESDSEKQFWQKQNDLSAVKIEYEKKQSQNQPHQMYGNQQSVTGAAGARHDTIMMGCNCGSEWTVTGQSMSGDKSDGSAGAGFAVKVEAYVSGAAQAAGYAVSGGKNPKYGAPGSQQEDYR